LKALIKPQYVDQIPKAVKGRVIELLNKKAEMENTEQILDSLGMIMNYLLRYKVHLDQVPLCPSNLTYLVLLLP
jgi:translation initiation factor RLI1